MDYFGYNMNNQVYYDKIRVLFEIVVVTCTVMSVKGKKRGPPGSDPADGKVTWWASVHKNSYRPCDLFSITACKIVTLPDIEPDSEFCFISFTLIKT